MTLLARRAALATPVLALAPAARAQDAAWPNRPVRLVVSLAPGGSTDLIARVIAQAMTAALPQPVIVENRPGANGNVGATFVARSAPDGHTLMLGTPGALVNNQFIYANMPFDPQPAPLHAARGALAGGLHHPAAAWRRVSLAADLAASHDTARLE